MVLKPIDPDADHVPMPSPPRELYRTVFKRSLDIVLVVASLPFVLMLILLMAGAVMLDGGAPFFRQRRIGRNGKIFWILKIRTMVPDAEARLQTYLELNPQQRQEWDHHQKLRTDPRVTRIGRLLRKTSLDELPQLWNVLIGEMSLVGPRPMMPEQRASYPGRTYFDLRPGLTGPWQISDRNASSFATRAEFDDAYASTLSLKNDISILARTFTTVYRGTGC